MARYIYSGNPGSYKLDGIMDALVAALAGAKVIPYVQGAADGSSLIVDVPDGVAQATIDAVVAAHDPAEPTACEVALQQQIAAEAALAQTDLSMIQNAIAGSKDVDTLREAVLGLADLVFTLLAVRK